MSNNRDQLAILGQRVLDTVIATYNPDDDPSLALALHPGQALADGVVQNGVTNELRLSEWLEDQYDYPLWLKRSDASSVSASTVGSLTAKSAYLAMVPWAQPSVPTDSLAYARISALIADARKDLGDNPDALPFNCEPTDFAEVDSTAWHVFDEKISSTTTTTEERPNSLPFIQANPQLWKMRAVTNEVVAGLSLVSDTVEQQRALVAELSVVPRAEAVATLRALPNVMDYVTQPTDNSPQVRVQDAARDRAVLTRVAAATNTSAFRAASVAAKEVRFVPMAASETIAVADMPATTPPAELRLASSGNAKLFAVQLPEKALATIVAEQAPPLEPPLPTSGLQMQLDSAVLSRLATIQIHDLEGTPVVTEVTTSGSELHVHFEYCMLTITRRIAGTRWWHPELMGADDWYVPGMKRGDMIKPSTDDAYAHCLPQALLLVRNVEFRGSWTAEARKTMENAVSFLGPFLMRAPTTSDSSTSDVEQVSVLGVGVQVIGELCSPLPPLPPMDDPAG